jgi:hypothetical protein
MALGAVITGDIVASTDLSKPDLKKLMKNLSTVLSSYQYEFFRGDSFQVYIKSPAEALGVLLQMRAVAMKLLPAVSAPATDIRASIGIGQVKASVKSLRTASDEVFVLSGRTFDSLKAPQRLLITSHEKNTVINIGLKVTGNFADYIFQRLTAKQAAVVFELLMNRTQTETARRLKKSQATIHKHVQSAGWVEIEKLLTDYKMLVSAIIL